MNEFRSEECHRFLQWLQSEIKRLEEDLPEQQDMGVVEVIHEVVSVAIFCFSKLAYKILCDTHGRVVPTNLLSEVKGLELFRDNNKVVRTRKYRGDIWDAYEDKEAWIAEVISGAQEMYQDVVATLAESDEIIDDELVFAPEMELIVEHYTGAKPQTSHTVIYLNLVEFFESYRSPEMVFEELPFTESWMEHGWFAHNDWSVILLARIIVQVNESYRQYMRRHYRRTNNSIGYDKYAAQDRRGFIENYKMLRERYVDPRLNLIAKLDE